MAHRGGTASTVEASMMTRGSRLSALARRTAALAERTDTMTRSSAGIILSENPLVKALNTVAADYLTQKGKSKTSNSYKRYKAIKKHLSTIDPQHMIAMFMIFILVDVLDRRSSLDDTSLAFLFLTVLNEHTGDAKISGEDWSSKRFHGAGKIDALATLFSNFIIANKATFTEADTGPVTTMDAITEELRKALDGRIVSAIPSLSTTVQSESEQTAVNRICTELPQSPWYCSRVDRPEAALNSAIDEIANLLSPDAS